MTTRKDSIRQCIKDTGVSWSILAFIGNRVGLNARRAFVPASSIAWIENTRFGYDMGEVGNQDMGEDAQIVPGEGKTHDHIIMLIGREVFIDTLGITVQQLVDPLRIHRRGSLDGNSRFSHGDLPSRGKLLCRALQRGKFKFLLDYVQSYIYPCIKPFLFVLRRTDSRRRPLSDIRACLYL